jgi:formate hydrogenlyase subunit 3/multisubunit Na+/H+ antiporter MnhD subunit
MFTKLGSIKISDFWRGLIIAIATMPLTIIYQTIDAGSLTFDWKSILSFALIGGLGYIIKNLGTGQNGNLLSNK